MICVGTMKEYTNNAKSVVQLLLRRRENVEMDMAYKVIIDNFDFCLRPFTIGIL